MIGAGGLDRLEQHDRECTRIRRELARMSSLYNAQNAPVIECYDSFARMQPLSRPRSDESSQSIVGPLYTLCNELGSPRTHSRQFAPNSRGFAVVLFETNQPP